MTAIPVDWADPEVVRANNYGKVWKRFGYWHKANAFIRVDFEPLCELLDIDLKTDWQSNFCIKVPRGELYLTPTIGAKICWDWDRDGCENVDWFWDWEARWSDRRARR